MELGSQPSASQERLGFLCLCSAGCAAPIQHILANKKESGPKHQTAGFVEEAHGLGFCKAQSNKYVLCYGKLQLTQCWSFPLEGQVPTELTDTLVSSLNEVV